MSPTAPALMPLVLPVTAAALTVTPAVALVATMPLPPLPVTRPEAVTDTAPLPSAITPSVAPVTSATLTVTPPALLKA